MANVRVLIFDMEGPEAVIQSAIRVFMEKGGGLESLPVSEAPAYTPPLRAIAEPAVQAIAKAKGKPGRKLVNDAATQPSTSATDGSARSRIIAELSKGPLSSMDVVRKTGLSSGWAYPILKRLREEKIIETREDPNGIYRLNYLAVRD